MVKIEAVIQPCKLDQARTSLSRLGIAGTLIQHVMADGADRTKAYYRGAKYPADLPRVKLELLAPGERVDEIVAALRDATRSSLAGGDDGWILIFEVADAIGIHTGAHLQYTAT